MTAFVQLVLIYSLLKLTIYKKEKKNSPRHKLDVVQNIRDQISDVMAAVSAPWT